MSKRGLLVLFAALIASALLIVIGQRTGAPPATAGGEILPGLEEALNDIDRVTIVKAGGETAATLERRPEGWVVVEKNGYAADVGKLRQNLIALAEARILERKTADPGRYDRLGVEDVAAATATGIQLAVSAPGRSFPALILGDAEGTKYRYARRAGEADSYLIDRDPDLPRNASQWVDAEVIDVRGDRVQRVTIAHPDGETVTIAKADPAATNFEVPVPAGRELLYPGVANVIGNSLRELKLEDVESAGDDAGAEPVVKVEFRTFDGLVVNVTGVERADQAWITLEARSEATASTTPAEDADATEDAEGAAASEAAEQVEAPAVEAERINRRVAGWRYRIAGFQYDQMTRRMADLLKPPA
jgi:hypothetical protein